MNQSKEIIILRGTIKRDIEQRTNVKGNDYYFTFLTIENQEKDLPIFI